MTVFPGRRRRSVLSLGLAVVLTVSLAVTGGGFWIALAATVLVVSAVAVFLPRLRADGNGIGVASLGGSFRVPWAEIDGFGYGWSRSRWCVQIKRRDGSLVPVRMLCSDARNGYSSDELERIVGELRERLAAATGTVDHGKTVDLGGGERFDLENIPTAPPRGKRFADGIMVWAPVVVALFLMGFGAWTAWDGATRRPHVYARLRAHGVSLTATFAGCPSRDECRLTVWYQGRRRTWDYGDTFPQFAGLSIGAPIAVLLDPAHPTTVYTAHDVETNVNAGRFSAPVIFGVALAAIGAVMIAFVLRLHRRFAQPR
jgi:hypothetical protein